MQQQGKLNDGKTLDYAKGLFIGSYRGLPTVRHGGAWGGYRAELLRFPQQHFSVACLCNVSNANPEKRAEQVAGVYLANVMKPERSASRGLVTKETTVTLTPVQLAAVMGAYRNSEEGNVARVIVVKGNLEVELCGSIFTLHALTPTRFVPVGFPEDIALTFDLARPIAVMKVTGDQLLAADYQKIREFRPSEDELAATRAITEAMNSQSFIA